MKAHPGLCQRRLLCAQVGEHNVTIHLPEHAMTDSVAKSLYDIPVTDIHGQQ